jgi:CheY-like chemotaxis protein
MSEQSQTDPEPAFGDESTGVEPAKAGNRLLEQLARRPVHLLFVDDDPLAEMTLRRAFRRLGLESPLTIAHDGLDALELLRDPWFPVDRCVVLLDLNMPRMDGHELLREIRSDPELAGLAVIVMTTSDEQGDIRAAYEKCAAGYFIKPALFSEYVDQLASMLEYWSRALLPRRKPRSGAFPVVP